MEIGLHSRRDGSSFARALRPTGRLLAWIEAGSSGVGHFIGAFVGEGATGRVPAARLCSTSEEATEWIVEQAQAFDLPVKWVTGPPR